MSMLPEGEMPVLRIEEGMMKDIRDEIFRRTVGQSLGFFNARRSGANSAR